MISFTKNEDAAPKCPRCSKELTSIWFQEFKGDLGKRCLYYCPHCRTCLGFSHRKGLTFGW